MSRVSLRTKWIPAVAAAPIGNASKALLLYLATRMTATGYIDAVSREQLADLFDVHPQRIAERIGEARQAGLLDQLDGTGVRGRQARYVATLPPQCVPQSSTHERGFLTGERYPQIGTHENPLGTGERYTQHARALTTVGRERLDPERDARGERTSDETNDGSDERAGSNSSLAAIFRKLDGRRAVCAGLRVAA